MKQMARRMFYVDEVRGTAARIAGEAAQHLRKVLRAERGQRYEVSDNETLWLAEVADFGKDLVEFRLLETIPQPPPEPPIHLLAALVKFDAFEWLLEKATELGASEITPVYSLRCDKGLDQAAQKRMERWRRIVFESGQQCRRVTRPELRPVARFDGALRTESGVRLFCDEQRDGRPLLSVPCGQPLALLVGPEGGWDVSEREAAEAAGWTNVHLGPRVLRAETAAMAALAVAGAARALANPLP